MFKKIVRVGILMMLILTLAFGSVGTQSAKAKISQTIGIVSYIWDTEWNGSFDWMTWDWSKLTGTNYRELENITVGEYRAIIEQELGYPVVILAYMDDACEVESTFVEGEGFVAIGLPSVNQEVMTSDSAHLSDYLGLCQSEVVFDVFRTSSKSENLRLTLFGYVNGDGKSCVLWSLDRSRNHNVAEKCGGGAELVCTVKLVEKYLKYDCDGGYDWLGQQIVNDPKWLAWADKFASMNGKK